MSALGHKQTFARLLDQLVGAREHARRHREAERLRSFQIDDQLVFRRGLHRQVSRFFAFEDTINIVGGLLPTNMHKYKPRDRPRPIGGVEPKLFAGEQFR
jgi:hypothetical protein